ncbi:flavin reductase family protein [Rhodopseudomonas sp. HC1]|uniref:flavin reductase family protein n=1 Tax=Rhodopseudomonas infernalis TaxID=2897386 RepID=UPI001EE8EAE8|nr:flavin reductase family protein [Rhodopseudomonas infernalis]MCG6204340.1 flavin reductase family protein [Rhodopseudomonas infernalis]
MRQFVGSVSVVTTWHGQRPWGMTINSFTSVCMDPPTILVCLNARTLTASHVRSCGRFGVNLLSRDQRPISELCARPEVDKYIEEHVVAPRGPSRDAGPPQLLGSLAAFDCRTIEQITVGSHLVAIAVVEAVDLPGAAAPLLYGQGRYMDGIESTGLT